VLLLSESKASNPEGAATGGAGGGEGAGGTGSKPLTGVLKFSNPLLLPNPSPKPLLKSLFVPRLILLVLILLSLLFRLLVKDPVLKPSAVALDAGAEASAGARGGAAGGCCCKGAEFWCDNPPEGTPDVGGAKASKPLLKVLASDPKSKSFPNEPNASLGVVLPFELAAKDEGCIGADADSIPEEKSLPKLENPSFAGAAEAACGVG